MFDAFFSRRVVRVTRDEALPGRAEPLPGIPDTNIVLGTSMHPPFTHDSGDGESGQRTEVLYVGMGCFWGVERIFWRQPGVVTTAAGYMGGFTPNPTYEEVCSGRTGHTEAVLVAYDPALTSATTLLREFWENHDSTTPDRQGNDVGTQYRSAIYWTTPEQRDAAETTREIFQRELDRVGAGQATTEIKPASEAGEFYYAEAYHQQYLEKNPGGYCNHGPNGLSCRVE
ncbi:MAG: peptide-methionine (S)-S-oxide reductase MsrA [Dermatophilus congolensis]|nr:peptide-methionine (S)-S-oxide reductase MsrA [Dermatophilus congolensis]